VSGAKGYPHFKGQVVRVSRLVSDYDVNDDTRAAVLRLLNNDSIRKATREEIAAGSANVTHASESPEVREEREKRMAVEAELEEMRKQLAGGTATTNESKAPVAPPADPAKSATPTEGEASNEGLDDPAAWQ